MSISPKRRARQKKACASSSLSMYISRQPDLWGAITMVIARSDSAARGRFGDPRHNTNKKFLAACPKFGNVPDDYPLLEGIYFVKFATEYEQREQRKVVAKLLRAPSVLDKKPVY